MPLAPLLGFDSAGAPLLNTRLSGDEASTQPDDEVIRRLGLASPLLLALPEAVANQKPTGDHASILQSSNCIVGPYAAEEAVKAREWLGAGAVYALVCAPAAANASQLAERVTRLAGDAAIPNDRLLLLLNVPSLADASDVERVRSEVTALAAKTGAGCYECCRPESVGICSGVVIVVPPDTPYARATTAK